MKFDSQFDNGMRMLLETLTPQAAGVQFNPSDPKPDLKVFTSAGAVPSGLGPHSTQGRLSKTLFSATNRICS
jgi:hypothetical protein